MSDRFATSIEIGGKIPRSKLQKLIDIINSSDMSHDWGESPLRIKSENDLLREINPNRKTLILVDLERAWGDTSNIEEQLQKKLGSNITYRVLVEQKYEYDGELRFWSPETRLIELNCDANGLPLATHNDLKEMLDLLTDSKYNINRVIKRLEKFTKGYKVPALEII